MTEEELISKVKSGDETAFKDLVEIHQRLVFNTALGLLQNRDDADDVAQEVFIKVYQCINNFKGKSKFSTWLYRITIAKSLDFLRSKKRKRRFAFLFSLFDHESDKSIRPPANFMPPDIAFEKKERAAVLFKAIDRLPDKQKTAFTLHNIEGLSYKEITEIMHTTLSSVESLIHRAKQNLREYLRHHYQNEG